MAERIRRALESIQDNWSDTLEPARRATESHAVTRLVNPPLPINADVLDQRAKAHERLAWWSRKVITGRKLNRLPAIDVEALTAFLTIHAQWLASSEHGGKARAELENSAAALGVIAAQNAPHRFPVGNCPGTNNDLPCPGTVKATVRADDDLLPSALTCDATPSHSWPAGEWRVLERRLHMNEKAARRLAAAITPRVI